MTYRPHSRVRVNPDAPVGASICMRCGKAWNRTELEYQHDWQGPRINNTQVLVCPDCKDDVSNARRTITIPADPPATYNVRLEPFSVNAISNWTTGPAKFYTTATFTAKLS